MVEHRPSGLARQRRPRDAGLFRAGHRDELLPRRSAAPLRGARHLPSGVPIPDDLRRGTASSSAELGLDAGADLARASTCARFRPLSPASRRDDMVLALGRSDPLKNLPLTLAAWRASARSRVPSCACSGQSPSSRASPASATSPAPSDAEVNELLNRATVFVQTSYPRGLLPAGPRVDGHRRRGRLHRCPRQPRFLRRRRELPDARRPTSPRSRRRSAGCSPIRDLRRVWAGRAATRQPATTGPSGSMRSSGSCSTCRPRTIEILGHASARSGREDTREADHEHATTMPIGISRCRARPRSDAALGVSWVMNACRNCWKITASGLSM